MTIEDLLQKLDSEWLYTQIKSIENMYTKLTKQETQEVCFNCFDKNLKAGMLEKWFDFMAALNAKPNIYQV